MGALETTIVKDFEEVPRCTRTTTNGLRSYYYLDSYTLKTLFKVPVSLKCRLRLLSLQDAESLYALREWKWYET